jgi:hypothetical protein
MPAPQFLVGDFTRAARVYDRQQTMVVFGLSGDDMVRNLVTCLVERRLALTTAAGPAD